MHGRGRRGVPVLTPVSDLMAKLKAFEAEHGRPGPTCQCCALPEKLRDFIVEGRKVGSSYRAIAAIVIAEGHKVSAFTVGRHLREHAQG